MRVQILYHRSPGCGLVSPAVCPHRGSRRRPEGWANDDLDDDARTALDRRGGRQPLGDPGARSGPADRRGVAAARPRRRLRPRGDRAPAAGGLSVDAGAGRAGGWRCEPCRGMRGARDPRPRRPVGGPHPVDAHPSGGRAGLASPPRPPRTGAAPGCRRAVDADLDRGVGLARLDRHGHPRRWRVPGDGPQEPGERVPGR